MRGFDPRHESSGGAGGRDRGIGRKGSERERFCVGVETLVRGCEVGAFFFEAGVVELERFQDQAVEGHLVRFARHLLDDLPEEEVVEAGVVLPRARRPLHARVDCSSDHVFWRYDGRRVEAGGNDVLCDVEVREPARVVQQLTNSHC